MLDEEGIAALLLLPNYEPSLSTRLTGLECVCDLWSVGVQGMPFPCLQLQRSEIQIRNSNNNYTIVTELVWTLII